MSRPTMLFVLVLAGCKDCHNVETTLVPLDPVVAPAEKVTPRAADVAQLKENFAKLYFELDSSALTAESKRLLDANAAILQRHPDLAVEIDGHADERGTTEYNIALGQRRARAVADYLGLLGVQSTRLSVVSFGEERPAATGTGETVWAQNRRAEFRVVD
jgi:peptidoglycan-associated lipoprotein